MLVSEALLKELSAETRKIGTKILVKATAGYPQYSADIINVIILPHSEFYRNKFMLFYRSCKHNAVKALKELYINFPYAPDYELGIGYILNIYSETEIINTIIIKGEFETAENLNAFQKENNFTNNLFID